MQMNDAKLELMRNEKIPKVLLKLGLPAMIGLSVRYASLLPFAF